MDEYSKLSARERDVIKLVAEAKCRKIIASDLNISIHTVDTHIRHLHLKTNTHSLSELLIWSLHNCSEKPPFLIST